jgi:hypothetical protein
MARVRKQTLTANGRKFRRAGEAFRSPAAPVARIRERVISLGEDPFAVIVLTENANRGKRNAARLGQIENLRQSYQPLTVATPCRDSLGRRYPRGRATSYTV